MCVCVRFYSLYSSVYMFGFLFHPDVLRCVHIYWKTTFVSHKSLEENMAKCEKYSCRCHKITLIIIITIANIQVFSAVHRFCSLFFVVCFHRIWSLIFVTCIYLYLLWVFLELLAPTKEVYMAQIFGLKHVYWTVYTCILHPWNDIVFHSCTCECVFFD